MTTTPADITDTNLDFSFDVEKYRADFPILNIQVPGGDLVYLDNAATTQKPTVMIDAVEQYYRNTNANIHRGVHALSQQATKLYEDARLTIARFINADSWQEIIYTRGTTEAINLVAQSYARSNLIAGDEIIISHLEHHSNIVPWQILCEQVGCVLKVVPINDRGEMIFSQYESLLSEKTKLVSIAHISNALGTINPIEQIIEKAHAVGAKVLIDGAQAAAHLAVDVQSLDCDFYAFSGHKLFAPTGIGVLYVKKSILETMPPYQGGGDMIKSVTFDKTIYNDLPYKFEAGTPNIVGPIGLAASIDYIQAIGLDTIAAYEHDLLDYATQSLQEIEGIKLIGTAEQKASVLSFLVADIHAHDVGTILDQMGVAIRTGHHCAQPVMDRFGVPATARASLAFYNNREDIDRLADAIKEVIKVFK